jgi:hypothetical protein
MASSAQATPTFKLVLVGDGGTGKVRTFRAYLSELYLWTLRPRQSFIGTQQNRLTI